MLSIFSPTFSKWSTPAIVKFVYFILMLVCLIVTVVVIGFLFQLNKSLGYVAVVLSPLILILCLMAVRIWLENKLATVRIAQYTQFLLENQLDAIKPDSAMNSLQKIEESTPFAGAPAAQQTTAPGMKEQ